MRRGLYRAALLVLLCALVPALSASADDVSEQTGAQRLTRPAAVASSSCASSAQLGSAAAGLQPLLRQAAAEQDCHASADTVLLNARGSSRDAAGAQAPGTGQAARSIGPGE